MLFVNKQNKSKGKEASKHNRIITNTCSGCCLLTLEEILLKTIDVFALNSVFYCQLPCTHTHVQMKSLLQSKFHFYRGFVSSPISIQVLKILIIKKRKLKKFLSYPNLQKKNDESLCLK